MAGPKKVSREEYDEFRSRMEDKYGYEEMSDEEKEDFDSKISQVAVVEDKTDKTDTTDDEEGDKTDETDTTDDEEIESEFDNGHPQSLDDDDNNEHAL